MSELKKICQVGEIFDKIDNIEYLSKDTFLDYEALILEFSNHGIASGSHSVLKDKYFKRAESLKEFIQHKDIPVIVFVPCFEHFHFGANSVCEWDLIIPSGDFSLSLEKGNNINVVPNTPFSNFFTKYLSYFKYESYFTTYNGTKTLETPHTKKALAFFTKNIIFLPPLKGSLLEDEEEFLSDLYEVAKTVTLQIDSNPILPEWTKNYFLQLEKKTVDKSKEIELKIKELEEVLCNTQNEIKIFNKRKQIIAGTGDALEREIEEIFKELGFEILAVIQGRDDLIIKYKDKIAVVEIKGVAGTAAEKYASQLEKWVSNYMVDNEESPKGILIVNTFKDKPIKERAEISFPHQMLKYSVNREHCLMTSLQLLGLYTEAMKNEKKEELINSLFTTVGVYSGFEKWEDFIEV